MWLLFFRAPRPITPDLWESPGDSTEVVGSEGRLAALQTPPPRSPSISEPSVRRRRRISKQVQRQVFEAFELEIRYEKAERRIEITATVSEAVATPLKRRKPSQRRAPWWY